MIHTSSIKTMFDNKHIDQLHFGGSIKTYVIPCKYNQQNPFTSVNGEYFILFFVPSMQKFNHYRTYNDGQDYNTNFISFLQKFDPTYTLQEKANTFALFKITTSGELAYIGNSITDELDDPAMIKASTTLSLFSTSQLLMDEYNNVKGIKFPISSGHQINLNFSSIDFTIQLFGYNYLANNQTFLKNINKISPYYSLGDRFLQSDNNADKMTLE